MDEKGTVIGTYRPVKDSLFDTFRARPNEKQETKLFINSRTFPDGTPKRRGLDTNMSLDGQLGYPRFFDLVHWMLVFEEFQCPADVRAVLSNLRLRLHFGECLWRHESHLSIYETVGSAFAPLMQISDGLAGDWLSPGRPLRAEIGDYSKIMEQFESVLKEMGEEGKWTHYYCAIVKEKAVRIEATTLFCVHANLDAVPLTGPVQFKVMLRGLDYKYVKQEERK
jgi:hypothetical protein